MANNKQYFNVFALNTSTGKDLYFKSLYLTFGELEEQIEALRKAGFNSVSYYRIR